MKNFISRTLAIGVIALMTTACRQELPENTTTETEFNQIIDEVIDIYRPVFEQKGIELIARKHWEDETRNAFASINDDHSEAYIDMFGGLARTSYITQDSLAYVVCHEIGHHQAGYPYYQEFNGDKTWASAEGQADYFASTKCMKQYLADKDNETYVAELKSIEAKLIEVCEENYDTRAKSAMCIRMSLAAKGFASFQASFTNQKFPTLTAKLTPMDRDYNDGVLDKHPAATCRYQTSNYGAICPKNFEQTSVYTEPNEGYCIKGTDEVGFRHHCWFNPRNKSMFKVQKVSDLPTCLRRSHSSFGSLKNDIKR